MNKPEIGQCEVESLELTILNALENAGTCNMLKPMAAPT